MCSQDSAARDDRSRTAPIILKGYCSCDELLDLVVRRLKGVPKRWTQWWNGAFNVGQKALPNYRFMSKEEKRLVHLDLC